jgi:hypothetical protein
MTWREIGRAEHGDRLWITWISFADGRGPGGDALYRSLVVADGAIAVAAVARGRDRAQPGTGAQPDAG